MISLCMIVKNEIKFIEKCLEAVSPYVDEIVVADTGSTDGTIEVLEKFNCRVFHFEWCNDYSKARNFSISKAKNNWILVIDADEELIEFDKKRVDAFIKLGKGEIRGLVKNRSFIGDLTKTKVYMLPRFFHKKYYAFQRDIHEELLPKYNFGGISDVETGIVVNHFGYLTSISDEKGKMEKYVLDLKRSITNKYDPYLVKHLGSTYLNLKRYDEAIAETEKIINDKSLTSTFYYPEAVTTKIKALCSLKKFDEALKMQDYFNLCQHYDDYIITMAYVFYQNKMYDVALDSYTYLHYKKDLNIGRLEIVNGLACANFELGNYEEALKWYEMININDTVKERIALCKRALEGK